MAFTVGASGPHRTVNPFRRQFGASRQNVDDMFYRIDHTLIDPLDLIPEARKLHHLVDGATAWVSAPVAMQPACLAGKPLALPDGTSGLPFRIVCHTVLYVDGFPETT